MNNGADDPLGAIHEEIPLQHLQASKDLVPNSHTLLDQTSWMALVKTDLRSVVVAWDVRNIDRHHDIGVLGGKTDKD